MTVAYKDQYKQISWLRSPYYHPYMCSSTQSLLHLDIITGILQHGTMPQTVPEKVISSPQIQVCRIRIH